MEASSLGWLGCQLTWIGLACLYYLSKFRDGSRCTWTIPPIIIIKFLPSFRFLLTHCCCCFPGLCCRCFLGIIPFLLVIGPFLGITPFSFLAIAAAAFLVTAVITSTIPIRDVESIYYCLLLTKARPLGRPALRDSNVFRAWMIWLHTIDAYTSLTQIQDTL